MYVEYFKKFNKKKKNFCNMFRKLNLSTEHDLESLMLLRGKSFQNVTFFHKNPQKFIEEQHSFYQKVRYLLFLCHLILLGWFNFLVHECLNLTRFCFSVSYALCIQQKKNNDKKGRNKLKILPTYLSCFFGACHPQCCTKTYSHNVESVQVKNM